VEGGEMLAFPATLRPAGLERADRALGEQQGERDERGREHQEPQLQHGAPPFPGSKISQG